MNATDYIQSHWYKKKVWKNLERPKHQQRFDEIAKRVIGTCCDVGCGFGHSTNHIRARLENKAISGIDFYEKVAENASMEFPDIQFEYVPSIDELSSSRFDVDTAICSEVIEHVEKDALLVEQLCELANKRVIITTPNKYVNDPGHLRVYTEDMLRSLTDRKMKIDSVGNFFYVVIDLA